MDDRTFENSVTRQIEMCQMILSRKASEYATEDRLHNFRIAASLQGCTLPKALAGMMAKHTVSIYDMCSSGYYYSRELWEEKITDHLNYLLLLSAIIDEEMQTDASIKA